MSEKDLAKVTILESKKDKGGTKETMQMARRHGQCKKTDILT